MAKEKVIILDFDGVLANTWQTLIRIFLQVATQEGIAEEYSYEQLFQLLQKEGKFFAGAWKLFDQLGIPLNQRLTISLQVNKIFNSLVDPQVSFEDIRWDLFPNVIDNIKKYKKMGYSIGVVSEHKKSRLIKFLQLRRVYDLCDIGIYSNKIKTIPLSKLKKQYPDLIYLGDSLKDIRQCKQLSIKLISVNSGINTHQDLDKLNPGNVVDNLGQSFYLLEDF